MKASHLVPSELETLCHLCEDALAIVDLSGAVVVANAAWIELLGCPQGNADPRWIERVHDDDRSQLMVALDDAAKDKSNVEPIISTPLIEVWSGVVVAPMLGRMSAKRTDALMEALPATIVSKQIRFAILDMTGVHTINSDSANALVGILRAVGLLGAEGLVVGLRPEVAQTMVQLPGGVQSVKTMRNLADGLRYCMARLR